MVNVDPPLTANAEFSNPHSWQNRLARGCWNLAFLMVYRWTPPRLGMFWRRFVLQCFGAKLGRTWIHPSTRIWAPWRLTAGDDVFIDRGCNLYNVYGLEIDDRVIISMEVFICTASHDHNRRDFPLIGAPVFVESDCWIAAQSFIMPGIRICKGAVVGARSVVTKNVNPIVVVAGNPAKMVGKRTIVATN